MKLQMRTRLILVTPPLAKIYLFSLNGHSVQSVEDRSTNHGRYWLHGIGSTVWEQNDATFGNIDCTYQWAARAQGKVPVIAG